MVDESDPQGFVSGELISGKDESLRPHGPYRLDEGLCVRKGINESEPCGWYTEA